MAPIRVLPVHLVNKIAAGEVIERPASIVKELVENALDAGASRIDVAVEDGGKRLIAVTDNGGGMGPDDLALALVPHATSKIAAEDDLLAIATMGFRGEALASIASVAHAHVRTRRRDEDSGHEIDATGDQVGQVRPCAAAPGTTVTIRDLFFNTPARRKFMRTTNTEFGHITEQLARLSLSQPDVAFTLSHNGRETLDLPAAESTRQRVSDLFGPDLAEALLPVSPRGADVSVSGLIAPPSAARGSAKWQYFFLNGRYIRDRVLAHALREAYRGRLEPSRYPLAMLFLEVPPADVDVNVHPTKIEVRFRDSQRVYGELLAGLRDTLNKANLTPDASLDDALTDAAAPATRDDARGDSLRQALADFFKSTPPPQPRLSFPDSAPPRTAPPLPASRAHSTGESLATGRPVETGQLVGPAGEPRAVSPPEETRGDYVATVRAPRAPALPARTLQIHDSYIVAACEDGLLIIDQHALHERLIYNDLRARIAESALDGQRLLIPQTLKVTAAEADALEANAALLARLGVEVEPFGPQTVAVQRFPTLLVGRGVPAAGFVRELIDRLAEDEATDPERLLEDVLEMMACKAAVKAGDPLTAAEVEDLLARRDDAEKGAACPHGRPTTLQLSLRDLQKQFKRT